MIKTNNKYIYSQTINYTTIGVLNKFITVFVQYPYCTVHRRPSNLRTANTRRGRSRGGVCRRRPRNEKKRKKLGWVVQEAPTPKFIRPQKRIILCVRCIKRYDFERKKLGEGSHPPPKFIWTPKHHKNVNLCVHRKPYKNTRLQICRPSTGLAHSN